ncbi:uncharacterized protein ACRADG_006806 [Cochliomyia hominivorax]
MFSLKSILLVSACLILTAALTAASPIEFEDLYEPHQAVLEEYEYEPILVRRARSPQDNNLDINLRKDQFGRQGTIDYSHNIFSSSDGRGRVDAYAQGTHNFDTHNKAFNGGIRGSWSF